MILASQISKVIGSVDNLLIGWIGKQNRWGILECQKNKLSIKNPTISVKLLRTSSINGISKHDRNLVRYLMKLVKKTFIVLISISIELLMKTETCIWRRWVWKGLNWLVKITTTFISWYRRVLMIHWKCSKNNWKIY